MTLLQIKVDDKLKEAIEKKADQYGVPISSIVRIVLVKSFLLEREEPITPGNVFNADRDNQGKGVKVDDLIAML